MIVREERPADAAAIRIVNEAAFGRPDEAALIESLREEGVVLCSLIAEEEGQIAGHILFSRMWIEAIPAVALAPMAVLPAQQRRGIGGNLIVEGLSRLHRMQERIVLVLGHPHYYSRFGFSVEKARHLETPFPPEAYMGMELEPGALRDINGRVRYAKSFGV